MIQLSKSQARRFLLAHQGLWPPYSWSGKAGILEFIERVGCIQFDPLNVTGQNPDLVLQSRFSGYTPRLLAELLYTDRKLLDGWDKVMSIYRAEDWPYFQRRREADQAALERRADGLRPVLPLVRAEIEQRGPLCSLDLDFEHRVDWPWGPARASRAALECLYFGGELVVHHRSNTRKYYDLAGRHLPADLLAAPDPNQEDQAYQDWHVLRRIGGVGLLWNRSGEVWLGLLDVQSPQRTQSIRRLLDLGSLEEIRVEGIPVPFYLRSRDLPLLEQAADGQPPQRASFIAPMDNLLWDRRQIQELFGFEYRWEVYTPAADRKYGYYVLPVLYGERFIGRVEPALDKRSRSLVIKNWWWEPGVIPDGEMIQTLAECFQRFSAFHNASGIQVGGQSLDVSQADLVVRMIENFPID